MLSYLSKRKLTIIFINLVNLVNSLQLFFKYEKFVYNYLDVITVS